MVIDLKFWHKKRVFITGHTGFKGSWLSLWLKKLGAEVAGFSLPAEDASLYKLIQIEKDISSIYGNILDFEKLKDVMAEFSPEVVIHMAAQSLVQLSYKNPIETYSTNVMGTVNLLEAVRQTKNIKVIVNITSDKCYENMEKSEGYKEEEPMGGYDPYSSSKGCAELVTSSYRRSFFNTSTISLASARAGNVIGGGDWAKDRLIPDLVRGVINNNTVKIRNPNSIRPWQHVLEPLSGYLLLAQKMWNEPKFAEAWNFGPADESCVEVKWIVDRFSKLWHNKLKWEIELDKMPHEATFLKLNCAKAKKHLGWQPVWTIEKAIEKTVEWYVSCIERKDLRVLSELQLTEYEKSLIEKGLVKI